jgi:hypothetical protein
MRIYEGSPRQDFEEVFRSIGAFLDQRGMREVLLAEAPDGFIVQGLVTAGSNTSGWSDSLGAIVKETLTFLDDDIARFMDEAVARRKAADATGPRAVPAESSPSGGAGAAGYYESAFRVLGRYMDEQRPRDVFLFEQDGAFVVRLLQGGTGGSRHTLAEFTREDITELIARGPALRHHEPTPGAAAASGI